MNYLLIALALVVILFIALIYPVRTLINIENNHVEIKIVLLKVIKIHIKEKTTIEKIRKKKMFNRKIPLKIILELIKKVVPCLKLLLSKSRLKLELNTVLGLSSADKTAITTGVLNIAIYNMANMFTVLLKEYSGTYNITPDFSRERFDYRIRVSISIRFLDLAVSSIQVLKILLKYKKYLFKKGGAQNGRSSNRRIDENYNG